MSLQITFRAGLLAALSLHPATAFAQAADTTLPVGETPVGETYVAETHGDWEIRCVRAEEGQPEPCQMYQLLRDQNGGPVAEFNIFDLPDEGQVVAGATIVTPLDTLLQPGIRLRVDDGPWSEYPFAFCQPVGCFARLGLTETNVADLRAGGDATVALVPLPAPDQLVQLSASLTGFTAAFATLEERNTAAIELFQQLQQQQGAASD